MDDFHTKQDYFESITREEWDNLEYEVLLERDESGGGWYASIPRLGEGLFTADGETPTEAVEVLETLRRESYDLVVASGRPIPKPGRLIGDRSLRTSREG